MFRQREETTTMKTVAPRTSVSLLFALFTVLAGLCAPAQGRPQLTLAPGFEKVVPGNWQTVWVAVENFADDEAVFGMVRVVLENAQTRVPLASYAVPVTVGKGANTVSAPLTVYVPNYPPVRFNVQLVENRDDRGGIIAAKTFTLPIRSSDITLLSVGQMGQSGAKFASGTNVRVQQGGHVLVPLTWQLNSYNKTARAPQPARVEPMTNPGFLPEHAAGYEPINVVYFGPDVLPDALSNAQANALRGWVQSGGIAVWSDDNATKRWQTDSRFQVFAGVFPSNPARLNPIGLGFAARISQSQNTPATWKRLVESGTTTPRLGSLLNNTEYWYGYSFHESPLAGLGGGAPRPLFVGLFLVGYLLLLAPVNYLILKRRDKREWAWLSVPALVIVFSASAFVWGRSKNGGRVLLGVASLVEAGSGQGEATAQVSAGVFAPRRGRYTLTLQAPNVLARDSDRGNYDGDEPLYTYTDAGRGFTEIRAAQLPMWGARTFGFHAGSVSIGQGVTLNLRRTATQIQGTITNHTGSDLNGAYLQNKTSAYPLPSLQSGATVPVRVMLTNSKPIETSLGQARKQQAQTDPKIAKQIINTLSNITSQVTSDPQTIALLAWLPRSPVPVLVDGQTVNNQKQATLLVIYGRAQP